MNTRNSRAFPDPDKIIWVKPENLRFKLVGTREFQMGLLGTEPGDWDRQQEEIEQTPKYRAIVEHVVEGVGWEHTELFALYAARLERGETVRGCTTLADVKRSYEERIKTLLESLRADGFQLSRTHVSELPYVYIARDGEILMGRQGNHRYALARILKSEAMPCIVRVRHTEWQHVRNAVVGLSAREAEERVGRDLAAHPDLTDVIAPERRGRLSLPEALRQGFRRSLFGRSNGTARK